MTKGRDTRILEATRGDDDKGLGLSIHQHATWRLESADEGARYAKATAPSSFYTRWGNPTVRRLEDALATLENAQAALATGSGMGAISTALLHYAREDGQRIVTQTNLYSATQELLTGLLADYGVDTVTEDAQDTDAFQDAITPETSAVYLETPSNPLLRVADIQAISQHAHEHDVPVLVDNTFASPVNQTPLDHGADVVLHSATKALGGHSDVTGGALVSDEATIEALWGTYKKLGPTLAPHDAFLVHRGLKTLGLRVERQNENANRLASFLDDHARVQAVHHPSLEHHPGHETATRQMTGYGGILSFEVEGGLEAGKRLLEATDVCLLGVSLGGTETLIQHPASMTHAPLSTHEREQAGIRDGLIRVSCGVENPEDLVQDLSSALEEA